MRWYVQAPRHDTSDLMYESGKYIYRPEDTTIWGSGQPWTKRQYGGTHLH